MQRLWNGDLMAGPRQHPNIDMALMLVVAGYSVTAAASQCGVHAQTLYAALRRHRVREGRSYLWTAKVMADSGATRIVRATSPTIRGAIQHIANQTKDEVIAIYRLKKHVTVDDNPQ